MTRADGAMLLSVRENRVASVQMFSNEPQGVALSNSAIDQLLAA